MLFHDQDGLPHYFERFIAMIENRWLFVLLSGAIFLQILIITHEVISGSWPKIFADAAVFQHGGWYITQGAIPYVDFWDVKPPLIYFLTTFLSLISGGNMELLHFLGWITSASAVTATSVITGLVIFKLTSNKRSSLAGGLSLFIITQFYGLPRWGMYPQFFSSLFAILSIYYIISDNHFRAGLAGAIAAGFYYPEGIVLFLSLLVPLRRQNLNDVKQVIKGALVGSSIIILPFILWGNIIPLVVETILAPLLTDTGSFNTPLINIASALGPGILIVPLAVYGWKKSYSTEQKKLWIISVGGLLYTLRVAILGPGSQLHLMGWMIFAGIGVGIAIYNMNDILGRVVVVVVLLLVFSSLLWSIGVFSLQLDSGKNTESADSHLNVERPSMQQIYWEKVRPESCHYRLSGREIQWIEMTDAEVDDTSCGKWPEFTN